MEKTKEKGRNLIAENKLPIKKASLMVRAINSGVRQQIMQFIYKNGKATVTEIHTKLNLDQPAASRHLAILRAARVVNTTREGRFIYYSPNNKGVEKIIDCVKQLHAGV
jgi:DNA-binding transcriptional ArsR family regulator